MSRHSKQAHTREFFTSGEKAKAAAVWGTQKRRLGQDSQRAFDSCNLCLARLATDAVAAPSGALYCRECIYENLLAQRQALDEARRAYDADQERLAAEGRAVQAAAGAAALDAFKQQETGPTATGRARTPVAAVPVAASSTAVVAYAARPAAAARGDSAAAAGGGGLGASDAAATAATVAALRSRVDSRTDAEKRAQVLAASFWVPAAGPSSGAAVPAPDASPRDPATGEFLRAKQLVTLRLTRNAEADEAAGAGGGGDTGAGAPDGGGGGRGAVARFMCPACMRPIVFQKTFAVRSCGHVVCDGCLARFVAPAKRCFVCAAPVPGKADVLALQQGGSSFAGNAGTQVEASRKGHALG